MMTLTSTHHLPEFLFGIFLILFSAPPISYAEETKDSTWLSDLGAPRRDLRIGESRAFLILPEKKSESENQPWVWYAPTFIGHHPGPENGWVFRQLLERGSAVAGVDVGESYGSPEGTRIYSEFYRLLTVQYGLSEKPCLHPQSRGGLMLYNWASENPNKVSCIAGIFPVCNLTSYPGLAKACGAYRLTEGDLQKRLIEFNPIDRLEPIAKAGVPVFHVHGDNDTVVPLEDNSAILIDRYKALGGKAELQVVPGQGHAVLPEFFQCRALVDFLLAQVETK